MRMKLPVGSRRPRRRRRRPSPARNNLLSAAAAFYVSLLGLVSIVGQCDSFAIRQNSWDYKGHRIGWEEARREEGDGNAGVVKSSGVGVGVSGEEEDEPILLLNGFGVGSFHQHRLMPELLVLGDDSVSGGGGGGVGRVVYGVDYLGQGRSWPIDCDDGKSENEHGLRYCIDTWADQICAFVEEVILPNHGHAPPIGSGSDDGSSGGATPKEVKVHLVGNSVGGHLSVLLASKRPDLFRSVCLLNATPVWGLNLPGWDGRLPAPPIPRAVGRYLFDRIRDLATIGKYLEGAYANHDAFDDELCHQIRGCTEGQGGHAAFASIMWSPPATFPAPAGPENKDDDFYANLERLQCDVLLVFGKDDPWCKPAFARRMNRALATRPEEEWGVNHRYVEIENVGHCPNHEAPRAVGRVVKRWIDALGNGEGQYGALVVGEEESVIEASWNGQVTMKEMTDCNADDNMWADISLVDRLVSRFL